MAVRRSGGAGARLSAGAAVALLGIALSGAPRVLAERPRVPKFELEWDAPAGCLDRDAARSAIEHALGAKPSTSGPATVVRVKITETEDGRFAADIWMYDPKASGERSFEGTACTQVAQATALIIAFALEESHEAAANATVSNPRANDPRRAAPAAPHARAGAMLALGAWLTGDAGSLPQVDAGLALVLEARHERFRADVIGSAWLPRSAYAMHASGSGGEFALYTGALRGCVDVLAVARDALSAGPCAGGEIGMTSASGIGLAARQSQREFWAAGLFGLSLRYLGTLPFAFGVVAELGVPLHRAAWQIDNYGTVFQPSWVIGRASLGVSWQFL